MIETNYSIYKLGALGGNIKDYVKMDIVGNPPPPFEIKDFYNRFYRKVHTYSTL